ncbi:MAG: hypothetical protein PHR79_07170 [Bacteroidales bacterium]|nr:hypothetical protein [Bacteroidales bacterium]
MKKTKLNKEELEFIFSKETIDEFTKSNIKGGEDVNATLALCYPNPKPTPQDQTCQIPKPLAITNNCTL